MDKIENSGEGSFQLLGAEGLLAVVFPEKAVRPSLSWLRRMQSTGGIPFKKCGRRVFFDPAEVRRFIDEKCTVGGVTKSQTKEES